MFPVKRRRRMKKSSVRAFEEVKIYCKCRMPELPGHEMIQCITCKEWFHIDTCISVPNSHLKFHWRRNREAAVSLNQGVRGLGPPENLRQVVCVLL